MRTRAARSASASAKKHNIQLKVVPKNLFSGIRVSTHLFNSEGDVDALVAALRHELA
jgi:selenocysteine lyase/cysteine desulfurase